jgi:hypothetical protein
MTKIFLLAFRFYSIYNDYETGRRLWIQLMREMRRKDNEKMVTE